MATHPTPWQKVITQKGNYIADANGVKFLKFYTDHHQDQDLIVAAPLLEKALIEISLILPEQDHNEKIQAIIDEAFKNL